MASSPGKSWFGVSPKQPSTNIISQWSTSISFNHLHPLDLGLEVLKYPGKQRLTTIHQIHWLKGFLFFFPSFFLSSERRDGVWASQKWDSCQAPQEAWGVMDLTWQSEGFTRPYAWLNRDARSLGLRRSTSIKGSCHLTTCFHKQKSVTVA